MPDEANLRARARDAVEQGKLPTRSPDRVWAGPGVDASCAVCDLPVTNEDLEFEIEFARDQLGSARDVDEFFDRFHLHRRCFAAWELERSKVPQ